MRMRKRNLRRAFAGSLASLFLCMAMLTGSTFAWFTDSVVSENNAIKTGTMDIGLYWTRELDGENTVWHDAEDPLAGPIFNYRRWEPGYTEIRYVKVTNEGDLAFKYLLDIIPNAMETGLARVIDVYYAEKVTENVATRDDLSRLTKVEGTLAGLLRGGGTLAQGVLYPAGEQSDKFYCGELILAVALKMQGEAGNSYQTLTLGETFDIRLRSTQVSYESDSFDDQYDKDATYSGPYFDVMTNQDIVIDEQGRRIILDDVEGNYLASLNGQKITLSNATFTGETLAIYLGRYKQPNSNTELNNVTVENVKVTNGVTNRNDFVSPAVYNYGKGVFNNCVMRGAENSADGYTPYDLGVTNGSRTTINGGSYGSIYVWSQAKIYIYGAKIDKLVTAAITTSNLGKVVIGAGTEIDEIVITEWAYPIALTIEDGAKIGKINYLGTIFTVEEWKAFAEEKW